MTRQKWEGGKEDVEKIIVIRKGIIGKRNWEPDESLSRKREKRGQAEEPLASSGRCLKKGNPDPDSSSRKKGQD